MSSYGSSFCLILYFSYFHYCIITELRTNFAFRIVFHFLKELLSRRAVYDKFISSRSYYRPQYDRFVLCHSMVIDCIHRSVAGSRMFVGLRSLSSFTRLLRRAHLSLESSLIYPRRNSTRVGNAHFNKPP